MPQHPAPAATASVLAVLPQQLPSAVASAVVPQHGLAAGAVAAALFCAGVLPQQAPAAGGVTVSARSVAMLWVVEVLMADLLSRCSSNQRC
jgi:hypothetical protein